VSRYGTVDHEMPVVTGTDPAIPVPVPILTIRYKSLTVPVIHKDDLLTGSLVTGSVLNAFFKAGFIYSVDR
jgi:hypothetical protein